MTERCSISNSRRACENQCSQNSKSVFQAMQTQITIVRFLNQQLLPLHPIKRFANLPLLWASIKTESDGTPLRSNTKKNKQNNKSANFHTTTLLNLTIMTIQQHNNLECNLMHRFHLFSSLRCELKRTFSKPSLEF